MNQRHSTMNVDDLIAALQRVEDKSLPVYIGAYQLISYETLANIGSIFANPDVTDEHECMGVNFIVDEAPNIQVALIPTSTEHNDKVRRLIVSQS